MSCKKRNVEVDIAIDCLSCGFKVYVKVTCSCKEQFGSSFVEVRMESVAELTIILICFIGFVF